MNDHRFIELLNLYIDRQISASEAAELEAELQAQPSRQIVYRQYCQMHRATMMVGERFQPGALARSLTERASHLRQTSHQSRARMRWLGYGAGLAAACLAVVLVRFTGNHAPTLSDTGTVAVAQPRPVAVAASVAETPRGADIDLFDANTTQPAMVSLQTLAAVDPQDYAAVLAALRKQERSAYTHSQNSFDRVPSLFDDEVYESPRFWPDAENKARNFRSRLSPPAQQAEFTAFQFQR